MCLISAFAIVAVHAEPFPVKIGISIPLSGSAVSYGEDIKNSLLFANQYLTNNRYELYFEDDRCNNNDAVSIARKFISIDKVQAVLGFACSGPLEAAAPIFERAHVTVISSGASSPNISNAGDYIFRTAPSDMSSLTKLLKYLKIHNPDLTILSEQTSYCEGINKALEALGKGKLHLRTEELPPGSTDIRSLILRVLSSKPKALFLNTQNEAGLINIVKELRLAKVTIPLYGIYFPGSPSFLNVMGHQADGIIFLDVPSVEEVLKPQYKDLYSDYVLKYGPPKSISYFFVTAFNSFKALDQALRSGGDIKNDLYRENVDGVSGPFSFDKNGDVVGLQNVMKVIKNGVPQIVNE